MVHCIQLPLLLIGVGDCVCHSDHRQGCTNYSNTNVEMTQTVHMRRCTTCQSPITREKWFAPDTARARLRPPSGNRPTLHSVAMPHTSHCHPLTINAVCRQEPTPEIGFSSFDHEVRDMHHSRQS